MGREQRPLFSFFMPAAEMPFANLAVCIPGTIFVLLIKTNSK